MLLTVLCVQYPVFTNVMNKNRNTKTLFILLGVYNTKSEHLLAILLQLVTTLLSACYSSLVAGIKMDLTYTACSATSDCICENV